MLKKFRNNLLLLFQIIIFVYFLILIFLYFYQRNLMYHPDENNYFGDQLSVDIKEVKVNTDDNIDLLGWYHEKDIKKNKTILFFHGNAGKLDNRIYKLNEFSKLDVNYLIFAYRGFSGNEGKPTEKGLYNDAEAAKNWLNSKNIKDSSIVLYGESLGTAVAVDLASSNKFAGVILESPFTSMEILAQKYYPYLPAKYILKDKYKSINKISKIKSPLLVMHGREDNIVPFSMGQEIYEKFDGTKYKYFNDYDDHMMDFNENLIKSLREFISSLN